jgi:hypothetical protein
VYPRDDYFRFGSVFIKKKITKPIFFKKNKTEPKPVKKLTGFGLVQFFWTKTGSNWFGSVLLIWLDFFRFGFSSDWFFQFQAYKTESEPNWSIFSKF